VPPDGHMVGSNALTVRKMSRALYTSVVRASPHDVGANRSESPTAVLNPQIQDLTS